MNELSETIESLTTEVNTIQDTIDSQASGMIANAIKAGHKLNTLKAKVNEDGPVWTAWADEKIHIKSTQRVIYQKLAKHPEFFRSTGKFTSIDNAISALNKQLKLEKPATAEKTPAKPTKLKVVDILVDAYAMVTPELLKLKGESHLSARFADLFDNGKVPSSVAKEDAPSIIEKFDEVYQVYFKRELDAEDNAAILLSDSDSEKLDRYKKKLDRELMAEKCNVRHTFLIDSVQSLSQDVDTVLSLVDSQKPVFTATEYKRLLGFFHPDKLPEDLKVNGQVLFNLVQTHRERLCGLDKKTRAGIEKLPGSVEDLMSRRK